MSYSEFFNLVQTSRANFIVKISCKYHFTVKIPDQIFLLLKIPQSNIPSFKDSPISQYSEWTVGPLNSVTCADVLLCLCSLLAAITQLRVSIGQKMQLTG